MKLFFVPLLLLLVTVKFAQAEGSAGTKKEKITVEVKLPENFNSKLIRLAYLPYDFLTRLDRKDVQPEINGRQVKWTLFSDSLLLVDLSSVLGKKNKIDLYEPGDSIHIDISKSSPVFSGKNADKFRMQQEINAKKSSIPLPKNPKFSSVESLQDYLEWSKYLDAQEALVQSVCKTYKGHVTPLVHEYLKADGIGECEYNRLQKFGELLEHAKDFGLNGKNLAAIFDSTTNNEHVRWLHTYEGKTRHIVYLYDYIRRSVEKKYNFDPADPVLNNAGRKIVYADLAKKTYKGEVLQTCLAFLITSRGLKAHTLKAGTPEIDTLLADFYAQQGYSEYKQYVREYEKKIRGWGVTSGHNSSDFTLRDQNGNLVSRDQFMGKIILMSISRPNCKECIEMNRSLDSIKHRFEHDSNFVFITIMTGEPGSKHINSSASEVTASRYILYTGSLGEDHPVISEYSVLSYPEVFLIDGWGKFIYNGNYFAGYGINLLPDPRVDKGHRLTREIYQQLAVINDGPYITYSRDSIIKQTVLGNAVTRRAYEYNENIPLLSHTDDSRSTFTITLKKEYKQEPSEYKQPEKLFVLSDIEGNFEAFRKLLQAGNVIDEQYNWTYGRGHLVFLGDMFDRGKQVTECLWLIHSLEEKAKAAGGYVHFILGNHEIMNLNGDERYVNQKYKYNSEMIGMQNRELYNESSELGRWLRSKNIMEKVGNLLFVHGGISREVNNLDTSLEEMNDLARSYILKGSLTKGNANSRMNILRSSDASPFWNRGYYLKDGKGRTSPSVVDSTLQKFNVSKIITGHTIVAHTVSSHYDGKVINTDTKHAEGDSEALIIENNRYYKMGDNGKREMLLLDKKAIMIK